MESIPQNIARMIASGESQTVEFKKSLSEQKEGLQALCGMLNSDLGEGMVLFGVAPDGSICGVGPGNMDTAQRTLSQNIQQKFDPPITPIIEVLAAGNAKLIQVRATRMRSVPYHEYDGRAFIRSGSGKRVLSVAEKEALRKRRDRDSHNGPWKCDRCGSWVGMLASIEITPEGPRKVYRCSCGGEFWPA
jgi:predicted HTH transcriptional regulator